MPHPRAPAGRHWSLVEPGLGRDRVSRGGEAFRQESALVTSSFNTPGRTRCKVQKHLASKFLSRFHGNRSRGECGQRGEGRLLQAGRRLSGRSCQLHQLRPGGMQRPGVHPASDPPHPPPGCSEPRGVVLEQVLAGFGPPALPGSQEWGRESRTEGELSFLSLSRFLPGHRDICCAALCAETWAGLDHASCPSPPVCACAHARVCAPAGSAITALSGICNAERVTTGPL